MGYHAQSLDRVKESALQWTLDQIQGGIELILHKRSHHIVVLIMICVAASACGADSGSTPHGRAEASGLGLPTPTTVPLGEASESEKMAFEQMFSAATADDVLTLGELEVFALEAVQCTRRAGYESELIEFDQESGNAAFSVATAGPDEGGGDIAADDCQATFYLPALDEYGRSHGPSVEEVRADQERRDQMVLACLAEAGFEFDDAVAGLADATVPEDLRRSCVQAYFE